MVINNGVEAYRSSLEMGFYDGAVTGIEPASGAWEPSNDALVQGVTCGELWSGVTPVDPY
jgi:hypothetical protein